MSDNACLVGCRDETLYQDYSYQNYHNYQYYCGVVKMYCKCSELTDTQAIVISPSVILT